MTSYVVDSTPKQCQTLGLKFFPSLHFFGLLAQAPWSSLSLCLPIYDIQSTPYYLSTV